MASVLLTSLVSYWKFDESSGDAADSSGSNTLTNNGSTAFVTGKIGNAADLEASSSNYFSRADNASLSITGNLSAAFWVNIESLPGAGNEITFFSKWTGTGNQKGYIFSYRNESGTLRFQAYTSANGSTQSSASINYTLSTATYYHIAILYTASTGGLQVYVNGSSAGTATGLNTSLFDNTAAFWIGQQDGGNFFDGKIDEFGIWSKVLTSDEVLTLYAGGAGYSYPFPTAPTFSLTETTTLTETINYNMGLNLTETLTLTESMRNSYGWVNQDKNSSSWVNQDKT